MLQHVELAREVALFVVVARDCALGQQGGTYAGLIAWKGVFRVHGGTGAKWRRRRRRLAQASRWALTEVAREVAVAWIRSARGKIVAIE